MKTYPKATASLRAHWRRFAAAALAGTVSGDMTNPAEAAAGMADLMLDEYYARFRCDEAKAPQQAIVRSASDILTWLSGQKDPQLGYYTASTPLLVFCGSGRDMSRISSDCGKDHVLLMGAAGAAHGITLWREGRSSIALANSDFITGCNLARNLFPKEEPDPIVIWTSPPTEQQLSQGLARVRRT